MDSTIARSAPPDPQLVAKVEAICAGGRLRGLRFQPPGPGETERDALTAAIRDNLLPSLQRAIEEIDALDAAKEQIPQLEPMLVSMRDALDAAESLDSPTMEAVERLFSPSVRLAREARLESCIYGVM